MRGTKIPAITELIRLMTNAQDIKIAIVISLNQPKVTNPTKIDRTNPFNIDTANSLLKSQLLDYQFLTQFQMTGYCCLWGKIVILSKLLIE